ncbi:MAG: IS200/IS605 family transposase [Saprospiraceae bacterium]|nr:IS200/IS605 family transposase [Saprospiraceae bacterium]
MKKLAHASHQCRYHLVFCPKYRIAFMRGIYKSMIEDLITQRFISFNSILIEFSVQEDHVHIFFETTPDVHLSRLVGDLKGYISSQMFRCFDELRKDFRSGSLWARGYFLGTCGVDGAAIQNYIQNQ